MAAVRAICSYPWSLMATKPDQKPSIAPIVGPDDPRRFTDSGIEIEHDYDAEDVGRRASRSASASRASTRSRAASTRTCTAAASGRCASTRATRRAKETNERFHYLIKHGSTGLSMAFDLPTQLGRDSDDPLCLGEVGRTGVAIDTIDDMRRVFDGIPLDEVSTSMTINAPAAVLLLLYELVGEEQGVPAEVLRGTTQNDILKEYIARGNFIYPPVPAMRLTTDLFAYCRERIPKWNTISISGYHMREKGCSAVQEVGFTLANAIAYVQAAIDAGLEVDEFGPRLAFFFNGHNNVFQEVAKFRAVRRMWARIMRERFGAKDDRSQKIRFHTQTGGVTLAAQQPENNIVRVALQGFAAVCGGTQSLHTNGFDEALALPTETAARIALRTQQILAHESGAADTVDPFAGSYFVEALTDEIEEAAQELIDRVDEMGGSVECIPFIRAEVEESAWGYEERYEQKQDIVVGVNEYVTDQSTRSRSCGSIRSPSASRSSASRSSRRIATRTRWRRGSRSCARPAAARGNLLEPIRAALKDRARSARSAASCARSSASTRRRERAREPAHATAEVVARGRPRRAARGRIPADHSRQTIADSYARPAERVLDLGCGAGDSVDLFRSLNPAVEWVGADIEQSAEVAERTRTDARVRDLRRQVAAVRGRRASTSSTASRCSSTCAIRSRWCARPRACCARAACSPARRRSSRHSTRAASSNPTPYGLHACSRGRRARDRRAAPRDRRHDAGRLARARDAALLRPLVGARVAAATG